ncbi:TonB-dependent receptor [Roseococcus pinisoli]|uniref:TonB-dependent siderophore receptor n=1 Tax=Roseococcus pinisoli TaxID=2835040 RepID=A0ABS5QHQ0_9PROT|nr:TonB-dependent siderophore receptor [Roseococcus pinisoli]MBS7812073.1 TonB-dependent siderophore receptor [Roseococcus pinisoli]
MLPTRSHRAAPRSSWLLATTSLAWLSGMAVGAQAQEAPAAGTVTLPTLAVEGQRGATDGYQAIRSGTAMRTDTPLRDTPQSISVVPREVLSDQAAVNLEQALRYVPGAGFAQGEGNRDTPVLRGQSTTADMFTDGVRDDTQYYRDLYNVDRVEVLKGSNAMIFGRGGGGGVINRVTLVPEWRANQSELRFTGGSFGLVRGVADTNYAINDSLALRLTGMYHQSDSYRDGVNYRRYGINPQIAYRIGDATTIRLSYENFRDERVADRGIPSFNGRPLSTGIRNFFGDPNQSPTHTNVNAVNLFAEHNFENGITLRNRFRYASYDKFYQNVFPGAVAANGRQVAISAYNNATQRDNLFNQTDMIARFSTGPVRHTLLAGMELGRQETTNLRQTGYFQAANGAFTATSINTSLGATRIAPSIRWRQSATDASNNGTTNVVSLYLQDQIELLPQLQLIAGLRYDYNEASVTNRRNGDRFSATDNSFSPRVGIVYRPIDPVSLYASYSVSYMPRAGEQLASLNLTNQALKPESFTNYEIGARWEINPRLTATAAIYQLERTNVAVTDPTDSTRLTLVNGTRTRGLEIGLQGRITENWSVFGGYANQNGEISSDQSASIRRGNNVPFLSNNVFSLWNRYDFRPTFGSYTPRIGAAVGVINQSGYYASTDNQVRIPGFTRVDAALFWDVTDRYQLQVNAENLFGAKYYPVANSNNNITPGAPFSLRFTVAARF